MTELASNMSVEEELDILTPIRESIQQWLMWKEKHKGRPEANDPQMNPIVSSWNQQEQLYCHYLTEIPDQSLKIQLYDAFILYANKIRLLLTQIQRLLNEPRQIPETPLEKFFESPEFKENVDAIRLAERSWVAKAQQISDFNKALSNKL